MIYPLVRELAVDGVSVTVTCRVLKIARQPYYRWLAGPVTALEWVQAHRMNALFDAHRDDPEFGYRFLGDEAEIAGWPMARRTAWSLSAQAGLVSATQRRKRGKATKAGPPVFDDLVRRVFKSGPAQPGVVDGHHGAPHR